MLSSLTVVIISLYICVCVCVCVCVCTRACVCVYQIMLCNLNLHYVICQLYLTKAEGKITRRKGGKEGGKEEKISEEMDL